MKLHLPTHSKNHISTKRPQDSFVHRILNDPYLDWFFMVISTVILSAAYIVLGFTTYQNMQQRLEAQESQNIQNPSSVFSSETLSRTLKSFDARAGERNRVTSGYNGVADPSL